MLSKFKMIHEHMKSNTNKEVEFLEDQSKNVLSNIINVQKELSHVAQLNENSNKKIKTISQEIAVLKQSKKNRESRFRYINLLHKEIYLELEKLETEYK